MDSVFFKDIKVSTETDKNEIYHGKTDYISASGLKKMKVSPAHFKYEKRVETDAMFFGSAYHAYILEPEKFEQEYFVFDDREKINELLGEGYKSPRSAKVFKEWKEKQLSKAQDKIILDLEMFEHIKAMKGKLFSHYYCRSLFKNGIAELSHYAECRTFDNKPLRIKIRPDHLKPRKRLIVDLKTAKDASKDGFTRDAAKFDYHIQAALYSDIMEHWEGKQMPWTFLFVVQEKSPPFAFNIFQASANFISQGRYEYENLAMLYQHCLETDKWQGYQVFCENKYGINELDLPPWAMKEINWFNH